MEVPDPIDMYEKAGFVEFGRNPRGFKSRTPNSILVSGGETIAANLFFYMARKSVGLDGFWDCVAFDEGAGIRFKDKDGIHMTITYGRE